jgi:hypothetical protein
MTDQAPQDSAPPPVRHLVKDGKWCVPVEQRPKGWERILPEPTGKAKAW